MNLFQLGKTPYSFASARNEIDGECHGVGNYYQYFLVICTYCIINIKFGLGNNMPIEERKRLNQEASHFCD